MYKANSQSKLITALLALSIAAPLPLVNASAQSLTGVNTSHTKNDSDFSRLIKLVLKTGVDSKYRENLAPIIGLDKAAPTKVKENKFNLKPASREIRSCSIVLDESTDTDTKNADKPKCVYLARMKNTPTKSETQYYKISLDGQLEKSVTTFGDFDKDGKPVRGSGKKVDNDINSPETQKAFNAEMAYWLKDWLKKEQKAATTKKQAALSKPAAGASL